MMMTPRVRKLALIAHVVSSVGWLGAVAAFLVLSIVGLFSTHAETVRSAYVAMDLIGQFAIVPLSLAAVLTGVVQGLGTQWGLFRYYWVLTKFTLTIVATLLLILHQFTAVAAAAARVSAAATDALPDVGRLGTQLVFDASAAIVVLLVTVTLSVYKPWGRIRYAESKDEGLAPISPAAAEQSRPLPAGLRLFFAIVGMIVAAVIIVHLAGGGMHH
jgi:predicted ferric reductase